jgi:peptide/nickel transport system ATP-binding protein
MENCDMSFVQAIDLSRTFDLSDPFIVRAISRSPKRILTAVDRVSFSIEKGTTYALVGESGSGKSTIAKMAVGLLRPTNGTLLVDGMNLNDPKLAKEATLALRRRIQMVFQSPYASLNPRWRVKDILSEPIKAFKLIENPKAQINRVHEL